MEELQSQQYPPQTQQDMQTQPMQTESSPYDTNAELEGINKELSDIEASVENDFATYISDLIDNDSVFEEFFLVIESHFLKK